MQTFAEGNTQIRLLGAWPQDWDVRFKLHAPMNTTVEGCVVGGVWKGLDVVPGERRGDVVYGSD